MAGRKPAPRKKPTNDLHDAARAAGIAAVRACLAHNAAVNAVNEYNFTPLQCAAMGTDGGSPAAISEVMQLLIQAGALLELASDERRRTPLYLAAEFSSSLGPIETLLSAGAKPDVHDAQGNHVILNARLPKVKQLLARLTGQASPPPRAPAPENVRLSAARWRAAKKRLDAAFEALRAGGLIALHDVGVTQDDGFADCSQAFHDEGGASQGLTGFCFYTRQDLDRAKAVGRLSLAFWGAPSGAEKDMRRVGTQIVKVLRARDFTVEWDGTGAERPTVFLDSPRV